MFDPVNSGIYIMQNTMVRGGGCPAGEKQLKLGVRGKKKEKRGKRNGGKLHLKKGEKALKMHLFGL